MKLKRLALSFIAAISVVAIGTSQAKAEECRDVCSICTSRVTIVATLKNAPAMKSVKMTLKKNGVVMMETAKHSVEQALPCNTSFEVSIELNGVVRNRSFATGNKRTAQEVIVAMD